MKLYTEEGNQDFVFNDIVRVSQFLSDYKLILPVQPVFFVRDPVKFPSLNRSHKRHPQTNLPDSTMFWE